MGQVWAIVVAAGTGSRFGGPKQFADLAGRQVLDWSVAAARSVCHGVVVVLPPDRLTETGETVAGRATRSGSVRAGLANVPDTADVIVVHDACRPLACPVLFERVIAAIRAGADAAVPAVSVIDTIKRVQGDVVIETLERSSLVAVQTPQAFGADALRHAHVGDPEGTDDAVLVEAWGGKVVVVEGDHRNLKVTYPDDLVWARLLLAGGR